MSDHPYRLPRTVIPERYELEMAPDLQEATFSGRERVVAEVREATDRIVLNAVDLEIDEAWVELGDGRRLDATVELDVPAQRAILQLSETLEPGPAVVGTRFRGVLNDRLRGFYRSTFTDEHGVERVIATTQFEPTEARRAFPCWDEPDLKAVFSVTLVTEPDLLALSNAREIGREPRGDRVAVRFADTVRMSTYLVAFVVGPLEVTDPVDAGGVPLRVVYPPGKGHLTRYALDTGAWFLRWFADYYAIPYPGDKLDLIAIPDFAFGAMENLGAVIFRDSALLIDPAQATQSELSRIADVIAHELAHMWFGDLVTMDWWDGIWLNEAFATFMELKAVDAFRPDWQRWLGYAHQRAHALDIDALRASRPVEFEVRSPEEADEMFDPLTYGKGSAVLRMFEQFVGEEGFRKGVIDYLNAHAFGNTNSDDLWAALEAATERPVGEIMRAWIRRAGFPLLVVDQPEGKLGFGISQERCFLLPDGADTRGERWPVPLLLRLGTGGDVQQVLLEGDLAVESDAPVEELVLNAGGHGFYRVAYPDEMLAALLTHRRRLEPLERYSLIDDVATLVVPGRIPLTHAFEALAVMRDEDEADIWRMMAIHLDWFERWVLPDAVGAYRTRVADIARPAHEVLGWEPADGESDLRRRLRGILIEVLGATARDPETITRARTVVDRSIADPAGVDPEVALASLKVVARNGTPQDWERFRSRYEDAATPQERIRYLQAMADVESADTAAQTFDMILDGRIRSQDGAWVLGRLLSNKVAGPSVWELVEARWEDLVAALPALTIRRIFEGVPALCRPDISRRVQAFLQDKEIPEATRSKAQALELLEAKTRTWEREAERFSAYLLDGSGDAEGD